jgi:hypothetical protein
LSSPIVSIRESYLLILSPYASFFTHSRNHCTARPTHALFHSAPIHTSLHSLIPLSFHSRPRNPCALCTTVIVSLLHTFCHFYCHTQSFFTRAQLAPHTPFPLPAAHLTRVYNILLYVPSVIALFYRCSH